MKTSIKNVSSEKECIKKLRKTVLVRMCWIY